MDQNNKLTQLLKVKFPFIQSPMLVVTTPAMVAEVSNTDCLGSLPLGYSTEQKAKEQISEVKRLTGKPFAINVFAYKGPGSIPTLDIDTLTSYYARYEIPFYEQLPTRDPYTYYTKLIEIIIESDVPVVSFHFGIPDKDIVNALHSRGIVLMASATCVQEARMIEDSGLDIVIAQGVEAGGNRGTFIGGEFPQVGLISLVPQIVDAVKIPVVAAGGIMDARGVKASFMLGAQGVQMGSIFLRSKESAAPMSWKNAVAGSTDQSTVLTNVWSGRYGRCINNDFVNDMRAKDIFPAPIQNYLTSKLRETGRQKDIAEIQSLWAGQSAHYAKAVTTREILQELISATFDESR